MVYIYNRPIGHYLDMHMETAGQNDIPGKIYIQLNVQLYRGPGNLVCTCDVIWFRSHSSDCRKMAEYVVRHSSVSLSVITFSTQNILELYFGR